MEHTKPKSVIEIFKKAWSIYKVNILPLIALSLIAVIISFLASAIISSSVFFGLWGLALGAVIASIFSLIFSGAARLGSIQLLIKGGNVRYSYFYGLKNIIPYIWVSLLSIVIVVSGIMLFVIPGIIAGVFLVFSLFAMVDKGDQGIAALTRSYYYVGKNFWNIFWKLFSAVFAYLMGSILIGIIFNGGGYFGNLVATAYNIFAIPFLTSFTYALYLDVKDLYPHISSAVISKKSRLAFSLLVILGVLVIILATVLVLKNYGNLLGLNRAPLNGIY